MIITMADGGMGARHKELDAWHSVFVQD